MNDMRAVIVPKSDQINADDLLAGPMTITVTKVDIRPGTEQPVSIHFDGDAGKPFKPCKSMARVMVHCWGADANQYVGRSMTLYCDPNVMWGGLKVGGIRISHLSDINATQVMALTVTKGSKKPFTVQPLKVEAPKTAAPRVTLADWISGTFTAALAKCETHADVAKVQAGKAYVAALAKATDAERETMAAHVTAALERIDAAVPFEPPTENDPALASTAGDWPGPDPEAMRREVEAV